MKIYILKPRFYAITLTAGLLIAGAAIHHIDAVGSASRPQAEPLKVELEEIQEPALEYLGEYKITHYCSCPICCGQWAENRQVDAEGNEIIITASGAAAEAGKTIAVDPDVIPLGSKVIINGQEYIAQDTGGAIQGERIDIYCASHEEALELGVTTAAVYKED